MSDRALPAAPDAAWVGRRLRRLDFRSHYQPIVALADGRIVGHEALTRFDDGTSPGLAFRAAADAGLATELELAALERAVEDAVHLPGDGYLSLNISPAVLLGAPDAIIEILKPVRRPVVVELLEYQHISDWDALRATLARIADATGARMAIDDLGSGASGLLHLVELRPPIVKLEAALVNGAARDRTRRLLVRSLADFCRRTGMTLVAEGVETAADARFLARQGVACAQGYHFGRPAPVERAEAA